jgi:hypothetical protein
MTMISKKGRQKIREKIADWKGETAGIILGLLDALDEAEDQHRAFIKSVDDEIKKQSAMWQPIETAPGDGSRILICTESGHVLIAGWAVKLNVSGWWNDNPTHWMPLPEPPEENKSA